MPDKIAQIGRQAALAAGAVMRQNYPKPHEITMKGAIDPVTETDFQCQEIIIGMIRQAFPDHGFLAEERAGEGDVGQPPSAVPEPGHPGLAWEADPSRPPAAGSSTPWTAPSTSPTAFPCSASPSPARRTASSNTG